MSTPRQIRLLASLTAKLMLAGLATLWAQTKRQPRWTQPPSVSTPQTGPQYTPHTVRPWSTTAMNDRVDLGLCDRCNGQTRAGALWELDVLVLALCGHHDRQHATLLNERGWTRGYLNMPQYQESVATA